MVEAGDAEHGVTDAVAFQAAGVKDLPGLPTGEDLIDADTDLAVGGVVFLLPPRGSAWPGRGGGG
ncbi:hypothetical protein GCM10027160_10640 [Streptomyces calidiresistens]